MFPGYPYWERKVLFFTITITAMMYEPFGLGNLETWCLVLSLSLLSGVIMSCVKHMQALTEISACNADLYRIEKIKMKAGVCQVEAFLCAWGDIAGAWGQVTLCKKRCGNVQWWLPVTVQNNSSCKSLDGVTSCKSSGMRQEQPLACCCGTQIKSSNRTAWETWEESGGSVLLVWDAR